MVIANPIYDVVFKRLMENKSSARYLIETLIEEPIEDLQVKPQEFTKTIFSKEEEQQEVQQMLTVYRLDYIATIKTPGGYKKVLIEVQKAHHLVDAMRFRNYLGDQYKKEDDVQSSRGTVTIALPIITIYLLGFRLPNIDSAAVKAAHQYIDLITRKVLTQKNEFIERLTHEAYFVQMPLIDGKLSSRLEKVLSVFEQRYFLNENGALKEYRHDIDEPEIKNMLTILNHAGADPEKRKEIEDEIEAWRIISANMKGREKFLEEQLEIIENDNAKKTLALEEKTRELELKSNEILEKNQALLEKDKALEMLRLEMEALRRNMK